MSVSINDGENNTNSVKFSKGVANLWHRRLGHVNNKYIQRIIKENFII